MLGEVDSGDDGLSSGYLALIIIFCIIFVFVCVFGIYKTAGKSGEDKDMEPADGAVVGGPDIDVVDDPTHSDEIFPTVPVDDVLIDGEVEHTYDASGSFSNMHVISVDVDSDLAHGLDEAEATGSDDDDEVIIHL